MAHEHSYEEALRQVHVQCDDATARRVKRLAEEARNLLAEMHYDPRKLNSLDQAINIIEAAR